MGRAAAAGLIVRDAGSDVGAGEIREHLTGHVAKWWLPDAIEFVDELPHTATGKLSKKDLRDSYRDYRFADAEAMVGSRLEKARALRLSARPIPHSSKDIATPWPLNTAYVMKGLTKTFPGAPKPVLNGIHLQFYHDAKIGIVGPNGSGKSTLMKIMAGRDTEFTGEAWPGEDITVGYLEQEPQLDPTKTVMENVRDGVRPVADMMDRFNAICAQMADPPAMPISTR